jgi:predicted MFS family arabinose efflux permease
MVGIFTLGTVLAGLAPSMPLLAAARAVQGWGGGAQYTIAYGVIAKAYPEAGRAKMLALLSSVWIVPGLVGPGFGSLLATTVGWRWAFFALVPLIGLALGMTFPALREMPGGDAATPRVGFRWPVLLALGTGLLLTGLASTTAVAGIAAAAIGLVILIPALTRVLPAGTFAARRGLPTAVAVGLLSNLSFFIGFFFLPLLLTRVAGRSLFEAGLAVTLVNLTWTIGSWLQQRMVGRWSSQVVVGWSCALMVAGAAITISPAFGAPVLLSYAAWGLVGTATGASFNALYLTAVGTAATGGEGSAVAALQTVNRLGIALGTGLAGAAVAVTGVRSGLVAAFALAVVAAAAAGLLSPRLNPRPGEGT